MSTPSPDAVWPGRHQRRGASYDGHGTNFAVWAPEATSVWLCLFDDSGTETRHLLPELTLGVWHGYLPEVRPGTLYGFRAEGPWEPPAGLMFDRDKLLLDPYARAVCEEYRLHESLSATTADGAPNPGDTAPYTPRSVVVGDDGFDWGDDAPPDVPWSDTVVYEAHVKGLTRLMEGVPEAQRGTFAGLGSDAAVGYLRDLGVTTVELMPVQHFLSETALVRSGFVNYWGYNTIGFFAPHAPYSSSGDRGQQVREFKQAVKNLHAAGLEVILDVVYNHTAEGGQDGPVWSFRGLNDRDYYLRDESGRYVDVTGCGGTVRVSQRQVLELVMDSLRYWVSEMHVDGFRFDLAPALLRNPVAVDLNAPFLTAVHQDPLLRQVKLIAEPWDASGEGYLLGRFPPPWCEWNDRYRDTVRDFWRGRGDGVRELATRLSGSSDLYADDDRRPFASINFVTSHDGFTLRDLVSYDVKHNEANGADSGSGTDDNRSWNCGTEGETDNPAVRALRRRQAANLLATLLLSTGVPMITAGDERGRTQGGNNNAYCLDDPTSWVSWEDDPEWAHLQDLTRRVLRLRAEHPALRRRHFFEGVAAADGRKDITWLQPSGEEMTGDSWASHTARTLGCLLAGDAMRARTRRGRPVTDTSYLLWLHAGSQPVDVVLPKGLADCYLQVLRTDAPDDSRVLEPGATVRLLDRSLALFEARTATAEPASRLGRGLAAVGRRAPHRLRLPRRHARPHP